MMECKSSSAPICEEENEVSDDFHANQELAREKREAIMWLPIYS